MNSSLIFSKLGLEAGLSQDLMLLLVVVAVSLIFAIFVGRFKILSVLISAYIALALLAVVPSNYLENYLYEIGFFLGVIILVTIFGKKLFDGYLSGWRVFALSFLETGLFLSVIASKMPREMALEYFSKNSYYYLTDPVFHFLWVVAPLIFIFFIQRKINQ